MSDNRSSSNVIPFGSPPIPDIDPLAQAELGKRRRSLEAKRNALDSQFRKLEEDEAAAIAPQILWDYDGPRESTSEFVRRMMARASEDLERNDPRQACFCLEHAARALERGITRQQEYEEKLRQARALKRKPRGEKPGDAS